MPVAIRAPAATALLVACTLGTAGCSGVLPRSQSREVSAFTSFEAARAAFERIEPYRTTLADLKVLGFDGTAAANVRQVPYPQLMALVPPNLQLSLDQLEPGIRDCVAARQACTAYEFRFGHVSRQRRGGFVGDFFNFRRTTYTTGWRFDGLVLARNGVVLFRSHGGEPHIEQVERRVNPLGPLQGLGESLPGGVP